MNTKKLWFSFIAILFICFSILGYYGYEIYNEKPPIPDKVITEDGTVLFTAQDILNGQNVWQSMGGQEVGTVWGHGAYIAPDWSADWLHKESVYLLDKWAKKEFNSSYSKIDAEKQAALKVRLKKSLRTNTYDSNTGIIKVSNDRVEAIKVNCTHYAGLFMNDPALDKERQVYAIPENSIKDSIRMHKMNAFFFWAAWACITERPGSDITYTNNWPPDETVGNTPSAGTILWTGFSVIMLLVAIGLLVYYYAQNKSDELDKSLLPKNDPLAGLNPTASMKATLKYFWIVTALINVQVLLGVITAHYGVEGNSFYGLKLDTLLPYPVSRTWHVQLAVFWIATSWLATGLYVGRLNKGVHFLLELAPINLVEI